MTHEVAKRAFRVPVMLLASALLLSALAGCAKSESDIVGKWRTGADSNAIVWEFSQDGSVLMGSTRGKFTFGDQGRMKIQTPFGTSVYQIEWSADHMVLKEPSGSKLAFTKLK